MSHHIWHRSAVGRHAVYDITLQHGLPSIIASPTLTHTHTHTRTHTNTHTHTHACTHTQVAKGLLKRYGYAYLATSISLSIVSFATFYALVSYGT